MRTLAHISDIHFGREIPAVTEAVIADILAAKPDILNVSTLQVLDNAARLGVLPQAEAEVLRSAARLYHDLTQILRLCVTGKFNPETSGENLLRVMARAGDTPDFSTLEARVRETQAEVRRVFREVVGGR